MFHSFRKCALAASCAGAALMLAAGSAIALPTLTPHDHAGGSITWRDPANMAFNSNVDMHQHWRNHNLNGMVDRFKTYSVWDNNMYRYNAATDTKQLRTNGNNEDYGHGYMEQAAKFSIRPGLGAQVFPNGAINDFGTAMNQWHANVNQTGLLNSNNVPVKSKINFQNLGIVPNANIDRATLPPGSDLEIRFDSRFLVGTSVNPMEVEFPFESELDDLGGRAAGGGAGGFGGFDGTLAYWTPSLRILTFNSRVNWYFSANNANDFNPAIAGGQFDFYSVALHEIGHVMGLDHIDIGAGMLQADQMSTMFGGIPKRGGYTDQNGIVYAGIKRGIDAGSLDGARGLYTIPSPGAVSLLGFAGVIAIRRRRP